MKLLRGRKRKEVRYAGLLDRWVANWTNGFKKWATWLESKIAHWSLLQRRVAFWLFVSGSAGVCGWTIVDNLLKLIK